MRLMRGALVRGIQAGLLLLASQSSMADEAEISLFAFDEAGPLADYVVEVDQQTQRPKADGSLRLRLAPGAHTLRVKHREQVVEIPFDAGADSLSEILVNFGDAPRYDIESNQTQLAQVAPQADAVNGRLRSRIVAIDGKPVAGARVYISGTPIELISGADGSVEAQIPAGQYSLSVIADGYASQTLDGIKIEGDALTQRAIELTPAGLELPEFAVLEPFVEGSLAAFVEERRTTSAVADILGAEQISRAGDSDAAGALKRVTGLTLVDGRYVYVRGLGERYSSVLLNGAQIPSPDPTRRVVPLDLFPVEILQGVLIQKSFSAEMPGEFGGGTIQLRTKTMPPDFFFKLSLGTTYVDGTSFEDGFRSPGGNRDWLGFDDTRALPDSIQAAIDEFGRLRPQTPFSAGLSPEQIEVAGEDLAAAGFNARTQKLDPNLSGSVSIGDSFGDEFRFGYLASVRLSHGWNNQTEQRQAFVLDGGNLRLDSQRERIRTERSIDFSAFLNLGIEWGENHKISSTTAWVRQSSDEVRVDEGFVDSVDLLSRFTQLQWEENALLSQQLIGDHTFESLGLLGVNWVVTKARATRDAPRTVDYRYDRIGDQVGDPFRFSSRSDANSISYAELGDDATGYDLGFNMPFDFGRSALTAIAGVSRLTRDRNSEIRRFEFRTAPGSTIGNNPAIVLNPPDVVLSPENIDPRGYVLQEVTRNTDSYVADQLLEAAYLGLDWTWNEKIRLAVGARYEDNTQEVTTFSLVQPDQIASEAFLTGTDVLPSVSLTWFLNKDQQLRGIYSQTVSRPDFRELSDAPFTDPQLDIETLGNPALQPASIKNYDLRYEIYFNSLETASVGLFLKDFTSPIERQQLGGSGDVATFFNIDGGEVYGIELDGYRSVAALTGSPAWMARFTPRWLSLDEVFIGANYAYIKSGITLSEATQGIATESDRPLQGQSPYVANISLSWQPEGGKHEATLLYNVFGERISQVGTEGRPDVYEQPFNQLDFVYSQSLGYGLKMKLRLRNLLDPEAKFVQGPETTRIFRKGREAAFSLEWGF